MRDDDARFARSVRGFKVLIILGSLGTLFFLALEARRENFSGEWRGWQARYQAELAPELAASFEIGIKQAFLPELDRVDRCQSCHVGIDDPAMAGAAQPLAAHPGGIIEHHPAESFGCTICHQGQGRMLTHDDAHGEVAHWEEPLLRGALVATSCGACHAENALFGHAQALFGGGGGGGGGETAIYAEDLAAASAGADILRRGKALVASSGCLGCHQIRGLGGTAGPDLTLLGDKGIHGYDFAHLPAGVERTPLNWLLAHFQDPGAVSPGSVMPGFGGSADEAFALAAYMLSLKSQDVPALYRVASQTVRAGGTPVDGAALYDLFCVACHGPELKGGTVPEIRTPSLANEGFLSVAGPEFLTHIITLGRPGTDMPAWGPGAGNLSAAQIAQLVDFIRSFAPDRAEIALVSSDAGDARYGRALYRGSCAACHGLAGEGGVGTRLNSADFLALASDAFLAKVIVEGRLETGMPAWSGFTTQEVSDLVALLRSWRPGEATPAEALAAVAEGPGDPAMGARLYRGSCSDCHGKDAMGSIGPSLVHPAFLSLASDEHLVHAILDGRPGTAMPAWKSLDAVDVRDLVAHLRALGGTEFAGPSAPVPHGDTGNGALLFSQTCAPCHGAQAVGGTAPQLRNPVLLAHAAEGFLYQTIARGRPGTPMRAFLDGEGLADLTAGQVADVVAWLKSLRYQGSGDALPRPVLGSAARGAEIYHGLAQCAACHGQQGEGRTGPAIGNPAFLRQVNDGFLLATLVLGREGTPMRSCSRGLVELDAEALMDVTAYVQAFSAKNHAESPPWRSYPVTDDRIDAGRTLFSQYCAACHGPDGKGEKGGQGAFAPALNNPEFLSAASDGFLVATIARGRENTPMRAFGPGHASLADLTTDDLIALVGFLRSWAPPSPHLEPNEASSELE